MSYQSFTILTQNRADLDAKLIANGVATWGGTGPDKVLVGVCPSLEIVQVPNAIVIEPEGPIDPDTGLPSTPAVHHGDQVYLVKLANELQSNDDDGSDNPDRFKRSKMAKSIKASNLQDTIIGHNGTFRLWKFGDTLRLIDPRDAPLLGVWQ
jgi:hypothetical protein